MKNLRCLTSLTIGAGLALAIVASPALAGTPKGEYERFAECPYTNHEVEQCIYSETTTGKVVIGSTEVPIKEKIILQGGIHFNEATETETFYNANNKENTLTKVPQNVPGGISGIVAPESFPGWLKAIFKLLTENGATGASATAEQVGEIGISQAHLSEAQGVALKLPIRLHLENPFLGGSCYIGSSTDPVTWNLTAGKTEPPGPNTSISGKTGHVEFKEKGSILKLSEDELVDNAYSVPTAEGCTEPFSIIVDPLIDLKLGLESPAGKNTTVLDNTIYVGSAKKIKESAE